MTVDRALAVVIVQSSPLGAGRTDREVRRLRMMENERRNARFGIHHKSFGQLHADLVGTQQLPQKLLVVEARTGWVAKRVTLAAVLGLESLHHRGFGTIRETPGL